MTIATHIDIMVVACHDGEGIVASTMEMMSFDFMVDARSFLADDADDGDSSDSSTVSSIDSDDQSFIYDESGDFYVPLKRASSRRSRRRLESGTTIERLTATTRRIPPEFFTIDQEQQQEQQRQEVDGNWVDRQSDAGTGAGISVEEEGKLFEDDSGSCGIDDRNDDAHDGIEGTRELDFPEEDSLVLARARVVPLEPPPWQGGRTVGGNLLHRSRNASEHSSRHLDDDHDNETSTTSSGQRRRGRMETFIVPTSLSIPDIVAGMVDATTVRGNNAQHQQFIAENDPNGATSSSNRVAGRQSDNRDETARERGSAGNVQQGEENNESSSQGHRQIDGEQGDDFVVPLSAPLSSLFISDRREQHRGDEK